MTRLLAALNPAALTLAALTLAALGLAALPGCSEGEKTVDIAVVPKGTTHEFWQAVHAGAKKAEAELNAGRPADQPKVRVVWQGPEKEDDRQSQVKMVQQMVNRGVKAIVLAPLDDKALIKPVEQAVKAGIPVVIFDSALAGGDTASFVATDNRQGGKLGGEHLAALLDDGSGATKKVIVFRYQVGSASTEKRERGAVEALRAADHVEIVSDREYGGATRDTAKQAAANLLNTFIDAEGNLAVDGIFTPNESTTVGMHLALKQAGVLGQAKLVGFDASEAELAALKAGEIDALVVQDPFKMGYEAVKAAAGVLAGNPPAERIDTGVKVVTAENLDDPEIAAVINPPVDQYLK